MKIRRPVAATVAAVMLGIAMAACGSDQSDNDPHPSAAAATPQGRPAVADKWEAAWASNDPQALAIMFTKDDSRYTDHAFGTTYTGQDGVAKWVGRTKYFVKDLGIKVTDAFGSGDKVSINWTFSGHLSGAPKPFSVPAVAIFHLRDGQIVTEDDYYNIADVLRQSGLPADTNFG